MEELYSEPSLMEFPLTLHLSMVRDKARMRAFTRALKSVITPGCTVVDIGTGTGVLAFMAAKLGAGTVIGLERSDIVERARKVQRINFPRAQIHFEKIDVLTDRLPKVQADIVVCELLGNFGLEENMITVLSKVRDKLLKPDGLLIPGKVELRVAPVQCKEAYRDIGGWKKPMLGMDFSPLQELAYNSVHHISDQPVTLLGAAQTLTTIDMMTVKKHPTELTANFRFSRAGLLHGFAGWFRAELVRGQHLSTGPKDPETHWGQVFFPVGEPIEIERGGSARFRFHERYTGEETRWHWSGQVGRKATAARSSSRPQQFAYSASREFYDDYAA
jgi:protein arginine N-methyltransferase 1